VGVLCACAQARVATPSSFFKHTNTPPTHPHTSTPTPTDDPLRELLPAACQDHGLGISMPWIVFRHIMRHSTGKPSDCGDKALGFVIDLRQLKKRVVKWPGADNRNSKDAPKKYFTKQVRHINTP